MIAMGASSSGTDQGSGSAVWPQKLGVAHQPGLGSEIRASGSGLGVCGHHYLSHRADAFGGGRGHREQGGVGHEDLRPRVAQDIRHLLGGKPGVDRDKDSAGERHREMGDEHLGRFGIR